MKVEFKEVKYKNHKICRICNKKYGFDTKTDNGICITCIHKIIQAKKQNKK